MTKILKHISLCAVLFFQTQLYSVAEWTILVYMQADNNLSDCVDGDISEMIKAYQMVAFTSKNQVNMLVQVDLPTDQKTWRFKVDHTGKMEDGSLNEEMGLHPVDELVKSGRWMCESHPAKNYGIILWNHGSGTEDYRNIIVDGLGYDEFWKEIGQGEKKKAGLKSETIKKDSVNISHDKRGILYDDSEKTCLTNQGLTSALTQIRDIMGKKIDFLGMDACLMAMVEVAYQMKDLVRVFVGSQEVEPGSGWPYVGFLNPLLSSPETCTPDILAKVAVKAYGDYYSRGNCTLSAINMDLMDVMCGNINAVATTVLECIKYKSSDVRAALRTARSNSMQFNSESYIDLYSFYSALHTEVVKLRQAAENETPSCWGLCKTSAKYAPALDRLTQYLVDGSTIIGQFVFANAATGRMQNARGVSIYYPTSLIKIHGSYPKTLFAQQVPSWYALIKKA